VQPQQKQQQQHTSNALALVSEGMKPLPPSSNANVNNSNTSTLIRAGDATENSNSKPTGILVVRFWNATLCVKSVRVSSSQAPTLVLL
jgi:hypothetical protein